MGTSNHKNLDDFAERFSLPAAYDAHYLALAQYLSAEFWSADKKLIRAVQTTLPWVHSIDFKSEITNGKRQHKLAAEIEGKPHNAVDGPFFHEPVPGHEKVRYVKTDGAAKGQDAPR